MDHLALPNGVAPIHYDICVKPDYVALTFVGFMQIDMVVEEETDRIVLNAVDLDVTRALIVGRHGMVSQIRQKSENDELVLELNDALEPGCFSLQMDYKGKINDGAEGLFAVKYGDKQASILLLTQFEAVAARRFMPCWDEPAIKATFSLSVVISRDDVAVSNMPVSSVANMEDNLQRVRFEPTPRMSTYLLFLAVGDLEHLSTKSGTTTISVVARRGSAANGQFALDSAVKMIEYYNTYFDTPYPLPKLDLVAAPGAGGFSAMENWGAILYFETALLLDPQIATEIDRQRVHIVVAHEMAHQWFGNLVTMAWWDNLWLNEGFASWMENKATDHFHPEWLPWLQSEADRQRAMRQDAQHTTHPVVQPVPNGEQADQAFDDITYRKGQAVIRMLENYVGEQPFRDGVRSYMRRYAYSNTVTENFWDEIERASGKAIKQIADDFTSQPGLPLVQVEHEAGAGGQTNVSLLQGQFRVDDEEGKHLMWHVPVLAASTASITNTTVHVTYGDEKKDLSVAGKLPVKVNIGHTAYYRTIYDKATLESIATSLAVLPLADQLGLLYDTWASVEAGLNEPPTYFDMIQMVEVESDAVIWRQIVDTLTAIDLLCAGLNERAKFRAFASKRLASIFKKVGWQKAPQEADNVAVLREALITALGRFDDTVAAAARQRFDRFVENPDDPDGLPAGIRRPGLRVVALNADDQTYEKILALARATGDIAIKSQLYVTLASAEKPDLADKSLALALTDEPARTTGPGMITRVALDNPDKAWAFVIQQKDVILPRLDALQKYSFFPSVASQSTSTNVLSQLRKFIDTSVPDQARGPVERFYSEAQFRIKTKTNVVPGILNWVDTSA